MEKIYVTYTCKNKKCRKAFLDLDPFNEIDDVPLETRYCPECVKNGFKNEPFKKEVIYQKTCEQLIRENQIVDDKDIKFIKKEFNKKLKLKQDNKQRIIPANIFNECLEVLSYQDWKQ